MDIMFKPGETGFIAIVFVQMLLAALACYHIYSRIQSNYILNATTGKVRRKRLCDLGKGYESSETAPWRHPNYFLLFLLVGAPLLLLASVTLIGPTAQRERDKAQQAQEIRSRHDAIEVVEPQPSDDSAEREAYRRRMQQALEEQRQATDARNEERTN